MKNFHSFHNFLLEHKSLVNTSLLVSSWLEQSHMKGLNISYYISYMLAMAMCSLSVLENS